MSFNSAINPYVKLVGTKPNLILSPENGRPTAGFYSQIRALAEGFAKTYIEIGSGSGIHLIKRAAADPANLYLGLEIRYKRVFRTAEKAEALGLKNLRVLQLDANYLAELFGPETIDGLYVLFPDPWDKRRWRKHRILSEKNLPRFESMLKPGAFLHYKTDHHEYFEETLAVANSRTNLVPIFATRDLYKETDSLDSIPSEFENLFKSKQLPICMVQLQKNRKNGCAAI